MSKDTNDDIKTTSAGESTKETLQHLWNKVLTLGNKKYGFNFSLHGWVIAGLGLLLLLLILK